MNKVLRREYERNPTTSVRGLMRLLDAFDSLDDREQDLQGQLDRALIAAGPTAARTVELVRKLNELQASKQALLARERKVADLGLRRALPKSGD